MAAKCWHWMQTCPNTVISQEPLRATEPQSKRLRVQVPVRDWAKGEPELGQQKWNSRGRVDEGEGRWGKFAKK